MFESFPLNFFSFFISRPVSHFSPLYCIFFFFSIHGFLSVTEPFLCNFFVYRSVSDTKPFLLSSLYSEVRKWYKSLLIFTPFTYNFVTCRADLPLVSTDLMNDSHLFSFTPLTHRFASFRTQLQFITILWFYEWCRTVLIFSFLIVSWVIQNRFSFLYKTDLNSSLLFNSMRDAELFPSFFILTVSWLTEPILLSLRE